MTSRALAWTLVAAAFLTTFSRDARCEECIPGWDQYPVFQTNTVYGVFEHDGVVYRGGWFSLFRWTGSDWETFGGGIGGDDGTLFAADFAIYETDLVVGGHFPTAGGIVVNSIATWDGTTFGTVGSGVGGEIKALVVYDGDLIAGGRFSRAGEVSARNIARWDGSTWHAMGSGVYDAIPDGTTDGVQDFVVWRGDLYVVGDFTHAGSGEVSYIARWNGSTWSDVGGGISMIDGGPTGLRGVDVHDDNLVIVGALDFAGGVAAINIARWDGVSWSPVGSGSDPYGGFLDLRQAALSVASYNGLLYVGADFSEAVNPRAEAVAVWDGQRWKPVGHGLDYGGYPPNPLVLDLEVCDGSLLMGGIFDVADQEPTDNMTRYTDCDVVVGVAGAYEADTPLQVRLPKNPMRSRFHFSIDLESPARVRASLLDVQGRRVDLLLDQSLSAGSHGFPVELESRRATPKGVYFLLVEAGPSTVTRKLVLVP